MHHAIFSMHALMNQGAIFGINSAGSQRDQINVTSCHAYITNQMTNVNLDGVKTLSFSSEIVFILLNFGNIRVSNDKLIVKFTVNVSVKQQRHAISHGRVDIFSICLFFYFSFQSITSLPVCNMQKQQTISLFAETINLYAGGNKSTFSILHVICAG